MPMSRPQGRQCLNVSLSHPVSMSRCLNVSASLLSQVSGLALPLAPAARSARRWRSGNRRADMRPETRDLPGGHETGGGCHPTKFRVPVQSG